MRARFAIGTAVLAALTVLGATGIRGAGRAALRANDDVHAWIHLMLFGAMAWLSSWSTTSAAKRVLLCCSVVLLGISIEVMEHMLFHNPTEWIDMVLDAMGAVAGTSLGALLAPKAVLRRTITTS